LRNLENGAIFSGVRADVPGLVDALRRCRQPFGDIEIRPEGIKHVLPRRTAFGLRNLTSPVEPDTAHDIRDKPVLRPVTSAITLPARTVAIRAEWPSETNGAKKLICIERAAISVQPLLRYRGRARQVDRFTITQTRSSLS